MNAHVHRAPHRFGVALDFFGDLVRDFELVAFNLNVDRRGQSAVQCSAEHPAGVEVEFDPWKLLRQFFAQFINVEKSRTRMMLGELHKDERVLRA